MLVEQQNLQRKEAGNPARPPDQSPRKVDLSPRRVAELEDQLRERKVLENESQQRIADMERTLADIGERDRVEQLERSLKEEKERRIELERRLEALESKEQEKKSGCQVQ